MNAAASRIIDTGRKAKRKISLRSSGRNSEQDYFTALLKSVTSLKREDNLFGFSFGNQVNSYSGGVDGIYAHNFLFTSTTISPQSPNGKAINYVLNS